MSYGRVPNVELTVSEKKEDEEEVFEEPVEEQPVVSDKKQKLKDHLAKCRVKSIAVRKEKKEIKLANKKPVGRPSTKAKKQTDLNVAVCPSDLPQEYKPSPEYVSSEEEEEVAEETVFTEKQKATKKPKAYKNVATSETSDAGYETMDYERLADMVANKMRPVPSKPSAPEPVYHEPPSNNFGFGNYEQMRAYENKIRDEERTKYNTEHETKQKEKAKRLDDATKKYFRKMPPVNILNPDNMWDNAFNPRR